MGREGERLAEAYLRRLGLIVFARRYATPMGEIDLIARDKDTIVFVEVKCRADDKWTEPQHAVNAAKQRKMAKAARFFLNDRRLFDKPCRFDVIAIVAPPAGEPQINHFADAFLPERW